MKYSIVLHYFISSNSEHSLRNLCNMPQQAYNITQPEVSGAQQSALTFTRAECRQILWGMIMAPTMPTACCNWGWPQPSQQGINSPLSTDTWSGAATTYYNSQSHSIQYHRRDNINTISSISYHQQCITIVVQGVRVPQSSFFNRVSDDCSSRLNHLGRWQNSLP